MTEPTTILTSRKAEAIAKVEKANRRLAKAGIAERFELVVGKPYDKEYNENGVKFAISYTDVTLVAPSIGYNGWTFVATLSFEEGGTVVRTVPGHEIDYRPVDKVCDQCHTLRERNETYVVRNEAGEYKQVGRNCLALFLGVKPILWVFGFSVDELGTSGGEGHDASSRKVAVENVVAAALAVSNNGRAYRPSSFHPSTKDDVQELLWGKDTNGALRELRTLAGDLITNGQVAQAIEAAANIKGTSDYAQNCQVLARSTYVDVKNIGIVASFAKVYANAQQWAAERKAQDEAKAARINEWYAKVGEKVEVKGVVTNVRELESQWGITTLIEVVSEEGYTFKWFATGYKNVDNGDQIVLSGTVKKLDSYNSHKATVLTRCKIA